MSLSYNYSCSRPNQSGQNFSSQSEPIGVLHQAHFADLVRTDSKISGVTGAVMTSPTNMLAVSYRSRVGGGLAVACRPRSVSSQGSW